MWWKPSCTTGGSGKPKYQFQLCTNKFRGQWEASSSLWVPVFYSANLILISKWERAIPWEIQLKELKSSQRNPIWNQEKVNLCRESLSSLEWGSWCLLLLMRENQSLGQSSETACPTAARSNSSLAFAWATCLISRREQMNNERHSN